MRKSPTRLMAIGLVAGMVALSACGDDGNDADGAATTEAPAEDAGTIVEVAVGAGSFTTLVAAVEAAGLVDTLSGEGPFTVFAPTDDAFAALPEGVLDALLLPENQEVLTSILTYHVVAGEVMSTDIEPGAVETVEGQTIELATDGGVTVNDVNVITPDVEASNGVIHVIDGVLLPPDVDPAALLESDMEEGDMEEGDMEEGDMDEAADQAGTIVDVAVEAGSFETLVAAVTAAELAETLSGEGPFTVFAPTDDAFAALPEALVPCLLEEENQEALASILTYHVVEGAVLSTDLTEGNVATVQGEEITVGLTDGVTINESVSVVTADIEASNGVIHVIDGVIVPPSIDVEEFLATC